MKFFHLLFILFLGCNAPIKTAQDHHFSPSSSQINQDYTDVFQPLDGKWKGKFHIYSDPNGQKKGKSQPKNIDLQYLKKLNLSTDQIIDVEQEYQSRDPHFQTVKIKDIYAANTAEEKIILSSGVNKVEAGKLLCIVDKPDEQIIHKGYLESPNTIIWHRSLSQPTKVEFFKETVTDSSYTIIGWGYYGADDPKKSPKTWFFGDYKRVE